MAGGLGVNGNIYASNLDVSGAITAGTWSATTIAVANGGTGATTLTGYIKGSGTSIMTASATIPIADVTGAAPLASPTFTGTPSLPTGTTAITQSAGNNTTAIATTAFVTTAVAAASSSGNTHTIGESYGGGIVFYTWDGGAHGLIAATTNQSDAVFAGTAGIQTRSTGDGIGAGLKNTSIIIAVNSAVNYSSNPGTPTNPINAAAVCNDYSVTKIVNGVSTKYGDWYLPSIYELKLMYQNIGKGATGANYNIGGLSAPLLYWASTEAGSTENWQLDPATGGNGSIHKSYTLSVRAIRMF